MAHERFIRFLEYIRRNFWWYLLITVLLAIANETLLAGRRDLRALTFFAFAFFIFFAAAGMIRRAWLLLHKTAKLNIATIIWADFLGAIGIIVLFAMLYTLVDLAGVGALSYGHCGPSFADTLKYPVVHNIPDTLYFSSVSFFTVGYGEICPMGLSKLVAGLNAFAGQIFTGLVVGIGVAFFLESNRELRKR